MSQNYFEEARHQFINTLITPILYLWKFNEGTNLPLKFYCHIFIMHYPLLLLSFEGFRDEVLDRTSEDRTKHFRKVDPPLKKVLLEDAARIEELDRKTLEPQELSDKEEDEPLLPKAKPKEEKTTCIVT